MGDKNLDGSLSKDEFKAMLQMMGQAVTDSDLNMYWPFLDTNKDGLISKSISVHDPKGVLLALTAIDS